ncbi:MAG: ATP-dependent 6-phosphofructokinase [Planctomycetota bacterium]|nr:MAG: ATP-dependent 6-phosphofructokinase [Planctomycetota bacterium]REJ97314.1 MAG: ATP-dependent 6-phosphofructokinase [Planctomycetota bacterium]REK26618.1 MAG: ATP-dependent 6-phosphofructokinase [Planctomycetota bacterium]REK48083.1 MAG: ATP-dependent 6-phosphofructokinase [Planctomycetota bacterium]
MALQQDDLQVGSLGPCTIPTPLNFASPSHPEQSHFRRDKDRICLDLTARSDDKPKPLTFEEAGPREKLFFDPAKTTAAIVTCGGLSPGLNNVIRSVYHELVENYGVSRVLGIRNGFRGLDPAADLTPMELTLEVVERIDKVGGTVLGSSRGPVAPAVMADFLQAAGIDILFCLGGDGTQRGAHALDEELRRRAARLAIVGIPKTIDNDVPFVRLSFGYVTALEKAAEVVRAAHVEARDTIHGIALVKLMGRHAGFIAAGASVVSQEVDFTLVPEIPFPLEGEQALLGSLERRMRKRGHAVIVVAEGAGQHLFDEQEVRRDASGNLLHQEIGEFLRRRIAAHFAERDFPVAIKYFDPSYYIRSVPANVYDRYLCDQMGRHAVHAAMAGKTGLMIGCEHDHYLHVPIPAVVSQTKCIDVSDDLWRAVLEATGQPRW